MNSLLLDGALWNWSSAAWPIAVVALIAYARSCRTRMTSRGWWFVAGVLILLTAFISPIGTLANGTLFSAHVVQHLLLLLVVPLCVVLSLPRRDVDDRSELQDRRPMRLTTPVGWICGLGAMWLWHVPSLCSAATEHQLLGIVRSGSFLLAGMAFWWPIFSPSERSRLSPPSAVLYLVSACLGCTLLGIYVTFTTVSVCPAFAHHTEGIEIVKSLHRAGLTPPVDQRLGGLLMWVPPCALYTGCIVSRLCRWYASDSTRRDERKPGLLTVPGGST